MRWIVETGWGRLLLVFLGASVLSLAWLGQLQWAVINDQKSVEFYAPGKFPDLATFCGNLKEMSPTECAQTREQFIAQRQGMGRYAAESLNYAEEVRDAAAHKVLVGHVLAGLVAVGIWVIRGFRRRRTPLDA